MFALASARVSPAPVARLPTRRVAPAARRVSVRAEKAEIDTEKILADLSEKWEKTEDKTSVIVYTTGAFAALWFSYTIIGPSTTSPSSPRFSSSWASGTQPGSSTGTSSSRPPARSSWPT